MRQNTELVALFFSTSVGNDPGYTFCIEVVQGVFLWYLVDFLNSIFTQAEGRSSVTVPSKMPSAANSGLFCQRGAITQGFEGSFFYMAFCVIDEN